MFAGGERFDLINLLTRLEFNLERLGRLGLLRLESFLLLRLALRVGVGVTAAVRAGAGRVALTALRAQVEVPGGEAFSRGGTGHRVQGKQT